MKMQILFRGNTKVNGDGRNSRSNGQSGDSLNSSNISQERRHHIVVLGAGFGGLWAARTLAEAEVDITLVDSQNYHTFFPLLYQVGAAELGPDDIAQPLRRIFQKNSNVRIMQAEVETIDLDAKSVTTSHHTIPYDSLVIGLGSKPNFYGIPGVENYALTLKSLEQGIALRNHILTAFERAACEPEPEEQRKWLTFVIVGGGPTGVEFAGALMELIHGSLSKDYPRLDLSQARVLLLEAADHLLEGMPRPLSDYTVARLQKMGVEVQLNSQLVRLTQDEAILKDGTRIPSRSVVWTAGVQGNLPGDQWGLATTRRNQVEVLPTLQVPDCPNIYVVGDLAAVKQDGRPLPMVAQVGIQTGVTAAHNIIRQLAGQDPLPFRYRDKGTLAVIGRNAAVAYIWNRSFTGFLAWLIWVGVHIVNLIGFRNRLLVLVNWAWAYLFQEHGVRLVIPAPTPALTARVESDVDEQLHQATEREQSVEQETTAAQSE
jgi:NADH dehydrogenase